MRQLWTVAMLRYFKIFPHREVKNGVYSMKLRIFQSTYKRDGKTIIQHEKQENGKVIVFEREIKGDELHVVISITLGQFVI